MRWCVQLRENPILGCFIGDGMDGSHADSEFYSLASRLCTEAVLWSLFLNEGADNC